ncbi:MAG: DNA primase [Gammaproteobacteria bacterium]
MATIPREFIRRLVDDADIVGIIGERVALKKRGRNHTGLCPFHSEKTPSFSVHAEKGFYHCFGCGAHGNALDFMVHHNGGDFVAGIESLAAMQGVAIPRAPGEQKANAAAAALGEVLPSALAHFRANLKKHGRAQEYLKGRGIDGKTAALFQLGYAKAGVGYAIEEWNDLTNAMSKHDNKKLLAAGLIREKDGKRYDYFRDRIMFPVFDRRGRLCGFGGRALEDDEPAKYLNSPESPLFAKRFLLYGAQTKADAARKKGRLLIVEGYMDVVRLAQQGFAESVATMGTAATAQQMGAALRMANTIIFAFDGDNAGRAAAAKALDGVLPSLRDGDSVKFMFLPDGEDPDSYIGKKGAAAFEERIGEAMPLGDFIERHLWQGADNDEGKTSAALAAGAKLAAMINPQKAPFLRALLQKRLSARAGLSVQTIRPATKPKMQAHNRAAYQMRPENKVFNLLCCLHAGPGLCKQLHHSPPLPPGSDDAAAEAMHVVLRRLLYPDDDDDGGDTVAAILHEAGFIKLGAQIQSSTPRRFAAGAVDVGAEFLMILANLQKEYDKRTGKGKNYWLEKMRQSPPPQ